MRVPLIPLNDQIVVEELDQSADMTSAGGIIMQTHEQNKANSRKAKVISVGPGKMKILSDGTKLREPMQVKVGDIVVYREYSPMQVTLKGAAYMILGVDNVCGIVEPGLYDDSEL